MAQSFMENKNPPGIGARGVEHTVELPDINGQ